MADYIQADPEIPPPSGVDVRDWEGVTMPAKQWQPGDEEPVMPPGGVPVRDWEGVTQSAKQWQPESATKSEPELFIHDGQQWRPAAEAPGAVTIATEWTTPRAGTTHFLINGRVIRNEWQPAGARLGIGVSYPLEPPPPPEPRLASLGLNPSTIGPNGTVKVALLLDRPTSSNLTVHIKPSHSAVRVPPAVMILAGNEGVTFDAAIEAWASPGRAEIHALSGVQTLTAVLQIEPPPPPPGPVEVESVTLEPTSVLPGESAQIVVRLKAPAPESVSFFVIGESAKLDLPVAVVISPGERENRNRVTARLGSSGEAAVQVRYADFSRTLLLTIRTPPQPTPDLHNVRDYGAKGDGTTRDDQAVQQAVLAAREGHTVYFPRGRWNLLDAVKVYKNGGIRFRGDGEASVILHGNRTGLQLGTGGQPYEGLSVVGLAFEGLPGKYMKDGNTGQAVQVYGPKNTLVEDCWFRGSGTAVFNAGTIGTTYGTVMRRLTINGWGVIGFFLNGGDTVEDCVLIQDDPSERLERSSHGIYIHSGCDNVTVSKVLIERARKYGIQLYGQDPGTTIRDVILRDVTLRSCANGLTLQQSAPDRARVKDLTVERLIAEDIYGGPALSVKQGDGATFRDCRLACRAGVQDLTCLQMGVWAPYEPGFWMQDMLFERLTLENGWRGIWALASHGGRFERIRVVRPTFVNCRKEIDFEEGGAPDGTKVPVTGVEIVR